MTSLFDEAINNALNSSNVEKVLEDMVANAIREAGLTLVSFNKQVGVNGEIGEIDVETSQAIIEVTTQTSRKLKQIQKLICDPYLNPFSKSVIVYAPNYKFTPSQDIINAGATVVYIEQELIESLLNLGEL